MSSAINQGVSEVMQQLAAIGVQPTGVADDSRQVRSGDLFVAYPGDLVDGREFIAGAIAQGACAVLWEASEGFVWNPAWQIANLSSSSLRQLCGSSDLAQVQEEITSKNKYPCLL